MIPLPAWLREYRREWFGLDALAGVTLAAYAIPVSLAYASLAGLPPQAGLYCYLLGGLGYALCGSSRHLAIGPTSAMSMVFGASLAGLAAGDGGRFVALACVATLAVAVLCGLAWLLRLSVLINFISESILTGFKAGAALAIASTQLPKLFGVPGGGDNFFERLWELGGQLGETHGLVLLLGLGAIALLLLGERWFPGRPTALGVVLLSLAIVSFAGWNARGVAVVGPIPAGLPGFGFDLAALGPSGGGMGAVPQREVLRLAFACFLLAYIESVSAARTFGLKHDYPVDARQELLGLGAANLLAGLFQGYASAGGLSQTAVNEKAGARTPLSLVLASAALALVLLLLTGVFRNLPQAVLAAVVLVAVRGLFDAGELRHLWQASRLDFGAALVALVGVLLLGILDGVILAVIASLLMLLGRAARPHVAFLGRVPGTNRFTDLARHPDNEPLPGVLAFRVEAALLYFNVEHVLTAVTERRRAQPGVTRVVCDLSNTPYVDIAGARMLRRLLGELATEGIEFRIAEAHGSIRDILRAEGLEAQLGHISRKTSLAEALGLDDPPGAREPS